jgi:HEAT repeat protein
MTRRNPMILVLAAGVASTVAIFPVGCDSTPRREGSPIADRAGGFRAQPGAPAVAADGEVYRDPKKPRPTSTPSTAGAVNETAPAPAAARVDPAPTPSPDFTPRAMPAPMPSGREAVIDLEDSKTPTGVQVATPSPRPAEAPIPRPVSSSKREPVIELTDSGSATPTSPPSRTPAPRDPTESSAATGDPLPTPTVASTSLSASELTARAIDLISASIRSPQPDVRANAVETAGLLPRRLESVISAGLSDSNEGVQSVAAMTIGKQRLVSLAPRARTLINSPSPYVEAAAVLALARNNEPVDDARMSRLAEVLFTSQSPRIRAHVAFCLGEIGNDSALPMLKDAAVIKMPTADRAEYNAMMLQFAEAMFKLGDSNQIEVIRAALQPGRPDDLENTALAVQILGELGDKRQIDQMVWLSAYRDPATKQLLPAEVRMAAASALAKLGLDRGAFVADDFVKDEDPALRAQAAAVFGDIGRDDNLRTLAGLLDDPVEQVRISAAAAIIKIARRSGTDLNR